MYYHNWDTQYNNLYIQYHKSPSFNHRQSNIYLYLITLLSIGIYHKLVLDLKKKHSYNNNIHFKLQISRVMPC